ncbi:MAG: folate-binding protein [Zoogloeaceae bacterium]|jgi:folate-binding protein YgfZ|nr:folate-binding protein [Zoogloeaceae bacterium]
MLSRFALIDISGPDARSFLQNQLTCDIAALPVGHAHWAAWCSAQGRMIATGLIMALEDERWRFVVVADLADELRTRLARYVFRSKVRLETRADLAVFGFADAAACKAAGVELPIPGKTLEVVVQGDLALVRLPDARLLLNAPAQTLPAQAGCDDASWTRADIAAGNVWIGAATKEKLTPHMADFEKVGVSFTKGCYPGQEVVARTQYLGKGKSKRHLVRLVSHEALDAGAPLFLPDDPAQKIGDVLEAASDGQGGFVVLASLADEALLALKATRVFAAAD